MHENEQNKLFALWFNNEPTAKSPWGIIGRPPMWKTFESADGMTMYSCPLLHRPKTRHPTFDSVHWQWMLNNDWVGQGISASLPNFLDMYSHLQKFGYCLNS